MGEGEGNIPIHDRVKGKAVVGSSLGYEQLGSNKFAFQGIRPEVASWEELPVVISSRTTEF